MLERRKPFPSILITLALLVIVALIAYFACYLPSVEDAVASYEKFGKFICDADIVLIVIIVVANVVEFVSFVKYGKRDEAINREYEYLNNKFTLFTFFKHYFAPIFVKGPYLYATEERDSAKPRIIVNLVVSAIKFVYWIALFMVVVCSVLKPEYNEAMLAGNPDYAFTIWILYLLINCNVFIFAIYRLLPAYESQEYEVVTYYSDGSRTTGRETRTNVLAILILSVIIYLYYSALYLTAFSNKLNRTIETTRFTKFIDDNREYVCMKDFYKSK